MAEEVVQEQEAEQQQADAVAEQQKDAGAVATKEGAEEQPKGHDFDKGLSKLQSRQKKYERETNDKLTQILDRLDKKAEPTQTETKAADAIDQFLEGRDPDDVPTVRDMLTLMKQVDKGQDSTAIAKAVQETMAPLLKAKEEADQKAYWAHFYRQHPELDEDAAAELWAEASEMAEEDGGSQSEREAAARAHFKHLVKSKERSLKRQKTPSTKSPTSPDGTQVEKEGASTAAAPEQKQSRDAMYRNLDKAGRL